MSEETNTVPSLNLSFSSNTSEGLKHLQTEYWERVRSYIVDQKWIRKPLSLSPAMCSRYGWKCISTNLLECVTCGAKLYPGDPKIELIQSYKSCYDKVLADLKDIHYKHCPWPLTPCPENFIRMIPVQKEEALEQFGERLKPLLSLEEQLPVIYNPFFTDLEIGNDQMLSLCKMSGVDEEISEDKVKSSTSLAFTGWTLDKGANTSKCLKCSDCQRTVGLFPYITLASTSEKNPVDCDDDAQVEDDSNESTDEPAKKKACLLKENEYYFDPLLEHRPWCLWINKNDVEESSDKAADGENGVHDAQGWKVFLKCLLRNITEATNLSDTITSPSKEQLRNVKDMLETWTDVFV